jgi:hypothetical protein
LDIMSAPHEVRVVRRSTRRRRGSRWILALACAWVTVATPFAPPGRAQEVDASAVEGSGWDSQAASGPDEVQRWWGAAGAILCATEVRLMRVVPAIGFNPYVIAAGVGGCLLAAMDVLTTT